MEDSAAVPSKLGAHTPEPWVAEPPDAPHNDGGTHWEIHDCYGRTATVYGELYDPETEANARRIVACVNACGGIDTAQLEAEAGKLFPQPRLLTEQRDGLVEALRKHHAYLLEIEEAGYGAYSKSDLHIETAAALAKVSA